MIALFGNLFAWRGQQPTPRLFAWRGQQPTPRLFAWRGQQPTPRAGFNSLDLRAASVPGGVGDAAGDCFPIEVLSGVVHDASTSRAADTASPRKSSNLAGPKQ